MRKLKVLSLFDGIATGRLVLDQLHIPCEYYASEIDKLALGIANYNWDDIHELGDACNISKSLLRKIHPDVIIAGSPCQGFSRQGSQKGLKDSRSRLFYVFLRILRYTQSHVNPEVLWFLENVQMKHEWEKKITDYLHCTPYKINSKLYSAQSRPRCYWTNIPCIEFPAPYSITLQDILQKVKLPYIKERGLKFDPVLNARERALCELDNDEVIVHQASKSGYITATDYCGASLEYPDSNTRRGRCIPDKSHCIDTSSKICVYYHKRFRQLTAVELERLQGLPDNYTQYSKEGEQIIENTYQQRQKVIGNGWSAQVIEIFFKSLI